MLSKFNILFFDIEIKYLSINHDDCHIVDVILNVKGEIRMEASVYSTDPGWDQVKWTKAHSEALSTEKPKTLIVLTYLNARNCSEVSRNGAGLDSSYAEMYNAGSGHRGRNPHRRKPAQSVPAKVVRWGDTTGAR